MQELQTVKTKCGTIYIEKIGHQEEDERIKIYDSEKRYLDYFLIETIADEAEIKQNSLQTILDEYIDEIKNLKTIAELLDYMNVSWDYYSTDYKYIVEYLHQCNRDEVADEWINKIGDYFILITEC